MKNDRVAWLAWTIFALSVALFLGATLLLAFTPAQLWARRPVFWPVSASQFSVLAYSAVGALIAVRRPRNAVGWIFCAMGFTSELYGFAQAYASYLFLTGSAPLNTNDLILILAENMWVVGFGLTPFLLPLFPNGHFLSRRWRLIYWVFGLMIVLAFLGVRSAFRAGSTNLTFLSPLDVLGISRSTEWSESVGGIGQISIFAALVIGVIALVLRLRRARGKERQQIKWFVYMGMFFAFIIVTLGAFFDLLHPLDPEALYEFDLFYGIPVAIAFSAIPIGAGIAILKYHLYDIDIIIRKTLTYALVVGLLAIVYFSSVILLQQIFSILTGLRQNEIVTVLSTLAIAALFVPLRNRIQTVIDRRFYRKKYDAQQVLSDFANTARDETDLEHLTARLMQVVDETMQPKTLSMWLKRTEREARR